MSNTATTGANTLEHRLPKTVQPSHYEIELSPDLEKFVFSGSVKITASLLESTKTIKLHAKELELANLTARGEDGTVHSGEISLCEETEIATVTFASALKAGTYTLASDFTGVLNDKLKGFYRSFWTDEAGKKHAIATTQFESTDARRAFPCFDEPEYKATFDVTLIVPEALTALSNGSIISTEKAPGGKKKVKYERTMKMSTYLVCFCIGEFVSSKPLMVNGIETRIWCIPGKEELTAFALAASAFAIDFYEKYFEIPYPGGKKIDHIAIPDFASGAMENLGLITYRETALLLDDKTATHAERKRVAEVVLHELAHMWFGDLVTMRWWNGLWLNESFATFMENLCLHHWKPQWEIWNDFGQSRAAASRVDALKSTHPIECPVNHADEAAQMFDVISYEKGCSVLYQIHEFIGGETFRKGIALYLKKHSYANTETHDLWDALEVACQNQAKAQGDKSAPPVRHIMDKWVFTAGHPVVEVTELGGANSGKIQLKQRAFKFAGTDEKTLWPVPITLRAQIGGKLTEKRFLMEGEKQEENLGGTYDWVVVNAGGSGFYRVTYDKALSQKLTAKAQENLSAIERFNLVNDAWACVRAGILNAEDYLAMVTLFADETDPNVWAILTGSLTHLFWLTSGTEREAMSGFIRRLVKPTADKLGFRPAANDSVQVKQLRGSLLGVLGTIGADRTVVEEGKTLFSMWKKERDAVDANVVPALVSIVAYHGDEARYEELKELSKQAKSPQEVQRFLFALARFRKVDLLEKTIKACLTDEVRTQDAPYLFAALLSSEEAGSNAWHFLTGNWQAMVDRFPENGVVRMVGAVSSLDKPELAEAVKKFFADPDHHVKSGEMALAQALEQLTINVALRERAVKSISQYLSSEKAGAKA